MFSSNSAEFVFPGQDVYSIEKSIDSYAHRVFFVYNEHSGRHFCVKMWRPRADRLYQTMNPQARARYLLEGLYFNRRCAPGVCLGIAPVQLIKDNEVDESSAKAIKLGALFVEPQERDLEEGKEYALIMRRLDDAWQLSNLLQSSFANKKGMEFLAQEIYLMHQRLAASIQDLEVSRKIGDIKAISEKLEINKELFLEAVATLSLPEEEADRYNSITKVMDNAFIKLQSKFAQRTEQKQIRRCHGDLKATNLWVCPEGESTPDANIYKARLLALDCIDFKPEFCHIDTLSDLAMLAIDVELYSTNAVEKSGEELFGRALATHYLETYLKYAQEQQTRVWPLLEYYLVEKAMVGTYGNIIYDDQPSIARRYLSLAYVHTEVLSTFGA